MKRVLFVCTGNSCRSQMAEGLLRRLMENDCEVFSAGTAPADRVHPWAVRAMREAGIDISAHVTKSISDLPVSSVDIVVTVCDSARGQCPAFPAATKRIHWSIPDPAGAEGTQREIEEEFRRVRELIREKLLAEFGSP